ncbi:MAG: mechanosensitive ion channel [Paracoccaceae bacterium]|nr:mechanosensitive ion channel [Paracoccaceae bacterium]
METETAQEASGGPATGAVPVIDGEESLSNGQSLLGETLAVWGDIELFLSGLLLPNRIIQVLIIVGLVLVAHVISRWVRLKVTRWLRTREGWPLWQMRFMAICNQRWRSIIFVGLLWLTLEVMRTVTWPSRSYLIGHFAVLATAWLVISIAGRLIRNRSLRKPTVWIAWILVTLHVLGLWEYFLNLLDAASVTLGATRISLLIVFQALLAIGVLLAVAHVLSKFVARRIDRSDDISPSIKVLSVKLIKLGLYSVAFVIAIQAIGFDLTTLTVLSGAIGLGLGFGLQKIVSNLVSGVILLMDKSIKPGDVISTGDTFGWISDLGARYASVVTRDGTEYLIPNEDLITRQVVNWSHSTDLVRLEITFGVSYDCDPHLVRRVAVGCLEGLDRVMSNPAPVCHIIAFGDSSVDYILRFWISDPSKGLSNVRGNAFLAIWDAFKANGIGIPYPHRDVRIIDAVSAPRPTGQTR